MKKTLIATVAALLVSGSVFAQTLVIVNGTKLDSSEIDRRAKLVIQQNQGQIQDSPEFRHYLLNEYVVETIVTQEARKLGLQNGKEFKEASAAALADAKKTGSDKQADFKANWNTFENQMLMMAYNDDVLKKNPVTDAQIQQRYDEVKKQYNNTDEIQVGRILTQQPAQAQAALKELAAKKSFANVAKKYSIETEVKSGKELYGAFVPLVDLKEANPAVYAAINGLKKGEYTKTPIIGEQVQAIFYVNDRRPITVEPINQLREGIQAALSSERVQDAVRALMQKAQIVPAK